MGLPWWPGSLLCSSCGDGRLRWALGPCSHRKMAQEEGVSLAEVRARVGASHGITDLAPKLHFYDSWAPDYDQDVATLQYRAPRLAVDCLSQAFPGLPHDALILDVACGTGLVAAELQARGFSQLHGVDGSPGMLEQARARSLYQHLSLCTLGQELLPSPEGGLVCLTTRTNPSNLRYKEALEATLDGLEQARVWQRLVAWPVDRWELATSELEVGPNTLTEGFISGIVYLYRKVEVTQVEGVRSNQQPPVGL
ncbi:methyltransferase-like protein 27 isoform X3 [Otolemur garnettii]|uniref:methyltransferase-like protein 27 isoform X3 n=1 Tax=Otolemur garnettii TaxID=30611 RepID=UPI000C7F12A8|nr:methyltransferase-like protein 27 isoform X3 [Otolemur garnettii]